MWDLPGAGIEPVSLAGRFLTTGSSGKSLDSYFKWTYVWKWNLCIDLRSLGRQSEEGCRGWNAYILLLMNVWVASILTTYKWCYVNILVHVPWYTHTQVKLLDHLVYAFSSLLNLTTLFLQSGCISLHSHQQCEFTWLDSSHPLWEWGDTSLGKKEEARQGKDLGVNPRSSDFIEFPMKPLLILEQGIKHKNEALGRWVFKVLSWFVLQERVVMVVGFT